MDQRQIRIQTIALLIDGENVSPKLADDIIRNARTYGDLRVRRVYGNMQPCPAWETVAGLKVIHTATAKNSADMLLAIDAVDLAYNSQIDTFVIVSSDGDFSHLAHYLRETGHEVVGLGETKTPAGYRTACSEFVQVGSAPKPTQSEAPKIPGKDNDLNQKAKSLIQAQGINSCMPMAAFGGQMFKTHDVRIGEHAKKNWRAYLGQYPELIHLDPRGPSACVRLKQ